MIPVAWTFVLLAVLVGLLGDYTAALFLAIAAGLVALAAPADEREDARRRSREPRYWQAHPRGGRG